MTTSYRDDEVRRRRQGRGSGSIRERSPGVWEVRVVVGFDPVHARSVHRSFTIHGDAVFAHARRRELADDFGVTRVSFTRAGAQLRIGELLERFFAAPQLWAPATVASHRWVVRGLLGDAIARRRLVTFTAGDVRATIARWQEAGVSVPTVSARWLVLRSALSWSVAEGILRVNPVAGMRGPPRPEPAPITRPPRSKRCSVPRASVVDRAGAALLADPGSRRRRHANDGRTDAPAPLSPELWMSGRVATTGRPRSVSSSASTNPSTIQATGSGTQPSVATPSNRSARANDPGAMLPL